MVAYNLQTIAHPKSSNFLDLFVISSHITSSDRLMQHFFLWWKFVIWWLFFQKNYIVLNIRFFPPFLFFKIWKICHVFHIVEANSENIKIF
jgi:hypothetical protein